MKKIITKILKTLGDAFAPRVTYYYNDKKVEKETPEMKRMRESFKRMNEEFSRMNKFWDEL